MRHFAEVAVERCVVAFLFQLHAEYFPRLVLRGFVRRVYIKDKELAGLFLREDRDSPWLEPGSDDRVCDDMAEELGGRHVARFGQCDRIPE